jgi:hypothetical protein
MFTSADCSTVVVVRAAAKIETNNNIIQHYN